MSNIRTPRPLTMAAVQSGVVASLIETLLEMDRELLDSLGTGCYGIILSGPGGVRRQISIRGGKRGLRLHFPSASSMAGALSGGKGALIPLPTGTAFLKSLKAFQTCAAAVSCEMALEPAQGDDAALEKKTRLLLTAALRGVCEVYNYDHWTLVKSRNIPEGTIGVAVGDKGDMGGVIRVEKGRMSLDLKGDKSCVNALLAFKDITVCYGVLSGDLPALGAMGDSRVMIKGRLPMIQGLFPLLDRFGELMK